MFTKAYILKLPTINNNYFKVRVPLFEDTTGTKTVMDALLCHDPGNYNGYLVGDCVFVAFEGETLNFPVIIGKLFTKTPSEDTNYSLSQELLVSKKANLPKNTTIDGYTIELLLAKYDIKPIPSSGTGTDIQVATDAEIDSLFII